MFDNISEKIKDVAKIVCFIGIAISIISAWIYMMATEFWDFGFIHLLISVLIAGVGSGAFYVVSIMIYGFGELLENVNKIADQNKSLSGNSGNNAAGGNDDKLPEL